MRHPLLLLLLAFSIVVGLTACGRDSSELATGDGLRTDGAAADDAPATADGADDAPEPTQEVDPDEDGGPAPEPEAPAPALTDPPPADGLHFGQLQTISAGVVSVQLMESLSGQAATEAARDDGIIGQDEEWELDVYDRPMPGGPVALELAADAEASVIDCHEGCASQPIILESLFDGSAQPFGGPNALYDLRVVDGTVVSLDEVYRP